MRIYKTIILVLALCLSLDSAFFFQGMIIGIPKVAESGRNMINYTTLHGILRLKGAKMQLGAKKNGAGTSIGG